MMNGPPAGIESSFSRTMLPNVVTCSKFGARTRDSFESGAAGTADSWLEPAPIRQGDVLMIWRMAATKISDSGP